MLLHLIACAAGLKAPEPPDTTEETPEDTGPEPLPRGDNLAELGISTVSGLLESTSVLVLDDTYVALCTGAAGLQIYDVSDPTEPHGVGRATFYPPANDLRCQHLAEMDDGTLAVTHHGDETSDGWLALVDVSDPEAPAQTHAWTHAGTAPEGIATTGTTIWVAAHDEGLLRFDVSAGPLEEPDEVVGIGENLASLALSGETLAVGTLGGEVWLMDLDGNVNATVAVAGPVLDLAWLADGSLAAACGSQGLDRIDPSTASVVAHVDADGSALDVTELSDGTLAIASWTDIRLYDPALALLGTEDPAATGGDAAVLAVAASGDQLYAGEWTSFRTYRWDPSVAGPDVAFDADEVDFGDVASGETGTASIVLENEGFQELVITGILADDTTVEVDPSSARVAAGDTLVISLSWSGEGALDTSLTVSSDDPDEGSLSVPVRANQPGLGVGDALPEFTYIALNSTDTYTSSDLGGPALLSYFATF